MIERDGTPPAPSSTTPLCSRSPSRRARWRRRHDSRSTTQRLAEEVRARLEDVQASRQRIVAAGDAERRWLERDLHDGAQQRLVALALRLRTLERATGASGNIRLADDLELLASELDTTIAEVRELARADPAACARGGRARGRARGARRPDASAHAGRRRAAPAPTRRRRGGRASSRPARRWRTRSSTAGHVRIVSPDDGDRLVLSVADDGSGGAERRAGGGLVGLADRLEALGGELAIDSALGGGTTLTARIPLATAATGDQAAGAARRVGQHRRDPPVLRASPPAGRAWRRSGGCGSRRCPP